MGFYRTLKTEHRTPRECGDLSPVHDWNSTTINGAVQTRTHGPAHELLTMAGAQITNSPRTLTYDTKGNMTTDDRGCGMAWDFDNMLQSFAANGVTDLKNATYEYDAIGRRVAKNVAETGGTQTTVFVQVGQQVTCEYTPGNATPDCDRKYAYGKHFDEVLSYILFSAQGETLYWIHQNRQLSKTAASTTLASLASYTYYSAHGQPVTVLNVSAAHADTSSVSLTGQRLDKESGLHHFRRRYYSDHSGRFLGRDPLLWINGNNFVANYFLPKMLDPSGLMTQDEAQAIIGCASSKFLNQPGSVVSEI